MLAASGQAASSKPASAQPRGGAPAPAKARNVSEAATGFVRASASIPNPLASVCRRRSVRPRTST